MIVLSSSGTHLLDGDLNCVPPHAGLIVGVEAFMHKFYVPSFL